MINDAVWCTDVEINAASVPLRTTQYVLSPYGPNLRWLLFKPTTIPDSCHKDDVIYLVNKSHYLEHVKQALSFIDMVPSVRVDQL